jgi:hypothetical protein
MLQSEHARSEWTRPDGSWVDDHWAEVTEGAPCVICGATEGCGVLRDEPFVLCARRPSELPMAAGGWLHHVAALPLAESSALASSR